MLLYTWSAPVVNARKVRQTERNLQPHMYEPEQVGVGRSIDWFNESNIITKKMERRGRELAAIYAAAAIPQSAG